MMLNLMGVLEGATGVHENPNHINKQGVTYEIAWFDVIVGGIKINENY